MPGSRAPLTCSGLGRLVPPSLPMLPAAHPACRALHALLFVANELKAKCRAQHRVMHTLAHHHKEDA